MRRDSTRNESAASCLDGRSGELGAEELTEKCLIATDLLLFLPRAIHEIA